MPALTIEYTEHELAAIREAAAADGKSVKAYIHDLSVREQQRRAFVDHAVAFWKADRPASGVPLPTSGVPLPEDAPAA